jgi:hypothetical protein
MRAKLLLFLLINAAVFGGAETLYRKYSRRIVLKDREFAQSIRNFEARADSVQGLFLGDSEVYYGVSPAALNTNCVVHNFAFPSEPIETTYWKVKHYLDAGSLDGLKFVVIQFEWSSLTSPARVGLQTEYDYYRYYDWSVLDDMRPQEAAEAGLNYFYIVRLRVNDVTFGRVDEKLDAFGYSHRTRQLSESEIPTLERAYFQTIRPSFPDPRPLKYYHELVTLLRSRNIKVIFLQMPFLMLMRAPQHPEIAQRDPYERSVARLIQKEFPGIADFNYRIDEIARPEYFSDLGHLNERGSNALAPLITRDLNRELGKETCARVDGASHEE